MSAVQTLHRAPRTTSPRRQFGATGTELLDDDPRVALVYAEISGQFFGDHNVRVARKDLVKKRRSRSWKADQKKRRRHILWHAGGRPP